MRDAGHRPHANYRGQAPGPTKVDRGPYGLNVKLRAWGPQPWAETLRVIFEETQANWGDRSSDEPFEWTPRHDAIIENLFAGGSLPQPLELITFAFEIDGCSRATTHQLVRTRIGAGFMQHGGRDNDWRFRKWTLPETIARAVDESEGIGNPAYPTPVNDWEPLHQLCRDRQMPLAEVIHDHLNRGRELYAALVDAGIPWQDARRVLPMGTQTYIYGNYSYPALAGVLANRLEHVMDWEINCVAQLMRRQIVMHCPPLLSRYLVSHSDRARSAKFAGLESWPPDGKWPVPADQANLPRQHNPLQNPFWVLTPDAAKGGPVQWVPTNGAYPHEKLFASERGVL